MGTKQQDDFSEIHDANTDWNGVRNVLHSQEIVDYRSDMTVRIWFNEQNVEFRPHWHTALEIITPVEGTYDVTVSDTTYHLETGDILLVSSGETHSIAAPESGKRFIFLMDTNHVSGFRGYSSIQSIMTPAMHITKGSHPYIYDNLYRILMQMRNEYFSSNSYRDIVIYSLLMNFLVEIGRNHLETATFFPSVRVNKQKEYLQKFNDVFEYIDAHYMDDLTLEAVASSVGFSKYHFTRLFKQYTNSTFYDYLSYKRLKVAETLLEQPDLSITEIAMQSGFSSISTFNRIFRQQKDCTPSEYRAMCAASTRRI